MSAARRLIRFHVDGRRHALSLQAAERVVRSVELDALPGAPAVIRGPSFEEALGARG